MLQPMTELVVSYPSEATGARLDPGENTVFSCTCGAGPQTQSTVRGCIWPVLCTVLLGRKKAEKLSEVSLWSKTSGEEAANNKLLLKLLKIR